MAAEEKSKNNRRDFLHSMFAFIPLGLSFAGISQLGLKFISPGKQKSAFRKVYAASLDDLPLNASKQLTDLKGKKLVIIRTGDKEVKALSTVCTHLGCTVYWQKENQQFYCPCHAGSFDADGKVTAGPPPRDLDSYDVFVEGKSIYVNFKELQA